MDVSKAAIILLISFMVISFSVPFSMASSGPTYTVTFNETGLPQNLSWYVVLNGTATTTENSSITFSEPVGSYYYFAGSVSGFNASPQHGVITVDGYNVTVNIHFEVTYYDVTFNESGLPAGLIWGIHFAGREVTLSNSSFVFHQYRGTYPFSITSSNVTFRPDPASGSITITNSNTTENVLFSQQDYKISFIESGLVGGTNWYVNVSGQNQSSESTIINFNLTNGSYEFSVSPIEGYNITGENGSFTVNGRNAYFQVDFVSTQAYTFIVTGLSSGTSWHIQIDNTNYTSTSSFETIYLPNATYDYRISLPYGYSANKLTGTVGYSNDVVFVNATNLLQTYIIVIVLVVLLDLLLFFYVSRRRSRKAGKQ